MEVNLNLDLEVKFMNNKLNKSFISFHTFFKSFSYISSIIKKNVLEISKAPVAQLGEHKTEDLRVPGSIPGLGIFWFLIIIMENI